MKITLTVIAAVIIPIVWGWIVHCLFARRQRGKPADEESTPIEYHI